MIMQMLRAGISTGGRVEWSGTTGNSGGIREMRGLQWASRGWRKVNCLLRRLGVKLSFALGEEGV